MSEWSENSSWSEKEQINEGKRYGRSDGLRYTDLNKLVENILFLYAEQRMLKGGELFRYRGTVDNYEALQALTEKRIGDVYIVIAASDLYPPNTSLLWNGTTWVAFGGSTELRSIVDGLGEDAAKQKNAAAVGKNSVAFGISEAKYEADTLKTEVRVTRGYDPEKQEKIIKRYGSSGPGSGASGDLSPEEQPDADSVMEYRDGNQILSNFEIEFDSTGAAGENSFTSGESNFAAAKNARAVGWNNYAGANYSSAEGSDCIAIGEDAHAEGLKNASMAQATHTEGMRNTAEGKNSHVEGLKNHTSSNAVNSHVEGSYNNCRSSNTHVEGMWNYTVGSASHAHVEGEENSTDAVDSHVEGSHNKIAGSYKATVSGVEKTYYSSNAHVEGTNNKIETSSSAQVAANAHVEGQGNTATAKNTHVEGSSNSVDAQNAHAEGSGNTIQCFTQSSKDYYAANSHVEGSNNIVKGSSSTNTAANAHAEGSGNTVNGNNAHVGGEGCVALGAASFVHGLGCKAFSSHGIAMGKCQYTRQNGSISLGDAPNPVETLMSGRKDDAGKKYATDNLDHLYSLYKECATESRFSAAVGRGSISIGASNVSYRGISIGFENFSAGDNTNLSVALGSNNIAYGKSTVAIAIGKDNDVTCENTVTSAAIGRGLISQGGQIVLGRYNKHTPGTSAYYILGCGDLSSTGRRNIQEIDRNGNACFLGDVYVKGVGVDDVNKQKLLTMADIEAFKVGDIPVATTGTLGAVKSSNQVGLHPGGSMYLPLPVRVDVNVVIPNAQESGITNTLCFSYHTRCEKAYDRSTVDGLAADMADSNGLNFYVTATFLNYSSTKNKYESASCAIKSALNPKTNKFDLFMAMTNLYGTSVGWLSSYYDEGLEGKEIKIKLCNYADLPIIP